MADSRRKKWWFNGAFGAVLFGSGISLAIEAGHWKHSTSPWFYWVLGGTLGICSALSGVVLLSRAGVLKREMEKDNDKL